MHTTYVEQEWQKVETKSHHADLDWAAAEGDEVRGVGVRRVPQDVPQRGRLGQPRRSKKHMKEVEKLRREMEERRRGSGTRRGRRRAR